MVTEDEEYKHIIGRPHLAPYFIEMAVRGAPFSDYDQENHPRPPKGSKAAFPLSTNLAASNAATADSGVQHMSTIPGTLDFSTATALDVFRQGGVIPAHPLALTEQRSLDERRQRALTTYYLESRAAGVAVGVHTTQFAIHDNGLLKPVLEISAEVAAEQDSPVVLVAGVQGSTAQAVAEAELAAGLGYQMVLLRPERLSEEKLLDRARAVGEVLPVVGFYLQQAVGGRPLSRDYWTRLAAQESVIGIKVAPFDRYQTLDVLHGVCRSGRAGEIALYTGNDNHILSDLATTHRMVVDNEIVEVEFVGGPLGQWAVWTERATELCYEAAKARAGDNAALRNVLTLDLQLTDVNAAIFDVANKLPRLHPRHPRGPAPARAPRWPMADGRWTLDPAEDLSPGQLAEIDRVHTSYPWLCDDDFVAEHLDTWLS